MIDHSTTNGTFINNQRIIISDLKDGDLIIFSPISQETRLINTNIDDLKEIQKELILQYSDKGIIYEFKVNLQETKKRTIEQVSNIQEEEKEKKIKKEEKRTPLDNEIIISRTEIEEEFKCPICQELLLESSSLQGCTHTFCRRCITEWYKSSKNCPSCRKPILKKPIRNLAIDNILEKLTLKMSPEEIKIRKERISENLKKENEGIQKLSAMVKKAQISGQKFLKLDTIWTTKEKLTFKQGVEQYFGKARIMYCGLTGLTEDWIKNSNYQNLLRVCQNLDVPIPESFLRNGQKTQNADDLRECLKDFLFGETYW